MHYSMEKENWVKLKLPKSELKWRVPEEDIFFGILGLQEFRKLGSALRVSNHVIERELPLIWAEKSILWNDLKKLLLIRDY